MKRCADGGFLGIVSYNLVRGGWHTMMMELTDDDTLKDLFDFDIKWFDKDHIRQLHFDIFTAICNLAGSVDLAHKIWRHYERVMHSPTLITIIGLLIYFARGQPSGDIATVILNTLAQCIVYMYIYCQATKGHPELQNYNDFNRNIRLRMLGDDSASCLNPAFESKLTRSWIDHVYAGFGEFGWTVEMPREPPQATKLLEDFTFVGHRCMAARVGTRLGPKTYYLPTLPFEVLLSINEYYKASKNSEVPDRIRHLGRYYASFERSFPYLFSKDPIEREYVKHCYHWLRRKVSECLKDMNPLVRKAAEGVPTLHDLVELYFPFEANYFEIERGVIPLLVQDPVRD